MTREGKTLLLLSLTYLLYGTSIYLSQGTFILPFPLNGFALFVIALQLAWWNKKDIVGAICVSLIGLTALIGSPPFWEIWMESEGLLRFEEINFFPITYYVHMTVILVFLLHKGRSIKNPALFGLSVLFSIGILVGIFLPSDLIISICFLLIVISLIWKGTLDGLNWIWTFLLFFEVINFISFNL